MKKYLLAIALTVVLPAVAHAQAVTSAPKASCCGKMKDVACSKDRGGDPHAGHDMSKINHSAAGAKAGADPHAGHDMSTPMAKSPAATATPRN